MIKTIATTKTAIVLETMAVVMKTSKVFRIEFIIVIGEKTIRIVTKIFKKSSITIFNKREKYILINGDVLTFV